MLVVSAGGINWKITVCVSNWLWAHDGLSMSTWMFPRTTQYTTLRISFICENLEIHPFFAVSCFMCHSCCHIDLRPIYFLNIIVGRNTETVGLGRIWPFLWELLYPLYQDIDRPPGPMDAQYVITRYWPRCRLRKLSIMLWFLFNVICRVCFHVFCKLAEWCSIYHSSHINSIK